MQSAPQAPAAPDPYRTTAAQTQGDIQSAIANAVMGNANVTTPFGSVTNSQSGTYTITDAMGNKIEVPRWSQTQTLSEPQQKLFDQQMKLGAGLNDLAMGQVDRLGGVLGAPISFDGAPNAVTSLNLTKKVGANDWSNDRTKVEEALYSRIQPQLERDRNQTLTRLTNQGIAPGSKAYDNAMSALDRSATDARMQAILAGGQEQSRLAGLEMDQAAFGNNAEQMGAMFTNTARERAIQEILLKRNQPINEVSALMGGGQVTAPQFSPFQGGQIAGSSIGQNVYNSANMANQQWQTQAGMAAQNNAGLFSLGSAFLGAGGRLLSGPAGLQRA